MRGSWSERRWIRCNYIARTAKCGQGWRRDSVRDHQVTERAAAARQTRQLPPPPPGPRLITTDSFIRLSFFETDWEESFQTLLGFNQLSRVTEARCYFFQKKALLKTSTRRPSAYEQWIVYRKAIRPDQKDHCGGIIMLEVGTGM